MSERRLSAAQRSTAARRAAYALHARYGSDVIAARARAGLLAKFEHQVDPESVLAPQERARRAQFAVNAHMCGLSIKAQQARQRRAGL